jgi:glutamyl/glutaminyl-tRNA synthetase
MGGTFILRVEDTDRARSTDESMHNILAAFRWLGIDWDEGPEVGGAVGPYFQSERLDLYADYAERLLREGAAYPCYCTPEEVEAGREELKSAGRSPMYNRRCRDLDADRRRGFESEGRAYSLRFKTPLDEELTVPDLGKGEVSVNLREIDDWVMVRAGGMPLYNFACAVDDLLMQIPLIMASGVKNHGTLKIFRFHGFQIFGNRCLIYIAIEPPPPTVYTCFVRRILEICFYFMENITVFLNFFCALTSSQNQYDS